MPNVLQSLVVSVFEVYVIVREEHLLHIRIPIRVLELVNVFEWREELEIISDDELHLLLVHEELLPQLRHDLLVRNVPWCYVI